MKEDVGMGIDEARENEEKVAEVDVQGADVVIVPVEDLGNEPDWESTVSERLERKAFCSGPKTRDVWTVKL